ncbi:hypothetical protein SAMN02745146_3219 [Hymenobacter daecheongensis DSM 21074]|uniref:Outer membrane protein beta-barrel domain-containing protein n=1 Tax=Hymenobacter daecheongensis DSM 21074 TaxID=1121955 RepID=A0A1M6JPM9_9BACT|nr:hypothetical protein [Hymenobacter daecheongensis]SHJ48671.1 hypothetical protein SAMN02745146_3219 [Hymenobacter daecheongensis DSM 21074]
MRPLILPVLLGALLSFFAPASVLAQRVLLRENVADDTVRSTFGPNRAFYNHAYLSYGLVAGPAGGAGAALRYGRSAEVQLGLRNKWRISQPLALGLDVRYARPVYHLAQTGQKTVPNAVLHRREYLALPQAQTEAFVRLSYGRRGNAIGRYVDALGWGGWVISSVHHYEDGASNGAKKVQTSERGLAYVNRWTYGAGARLGSGRYALVGRYRLSHVFRPGTQPRYPELPRWLLGLELSWL